MLEDDLDLHRIAVLLGDFIVLAKQHESIIAIFPPINKSLVKVEVFLSHILPKLKILILLT